MKLTLSQYRELRDSYQGFCTSCEEWTRDQTEPDAQEYECPECGQPTVIGAELALVLEAFELDETDETDL